MNPANMLTLFVLAFSLLISNAAGLAPEAIVGGLRVGFFLYPAWVHIYTPDYENDCGGALIADDLVLTSATCFYENDSFLEPYAAVTVGASNLSDSSAVDFVRIDKIYVHKNFTPLEDNAALNDIAVLRLSRKLNTRYSSITGTIALPTDNNTYEGKTAVVVGYGWDEVYLSSAENNEEAEVQGSTEGLMKYALVKVLKNTSCNVNHSSFLCGQVIQKRGERYKGICNGDLGNALKYNNKVIGIASYFGSSGCDESEEPAIYTRVSSHLPFIKGVMDGQPTLDTHIITAKPHFLRFYFE